MVAASLSAVGEPTLVTRWLFSETELFGAAIWSSRLVRTWESKSLTNGTGTEYGDNMIDGLKQIVKSDVTVGIMQMNKSAVKAALDESPGIADSFAPYVFLSPPSVGSKAMADGIHSLL